MTHSRRSFIKSSTFLGCGIIAHSGFVSAMLKRADEFLPSVGVCTNLRNIDMLADMGFSYIEEGVQGFLVPDKPEDEFLAKLEVIKKARLPVIACNSFIPGSLKSVGPDADHDGILEFAETAFRRAQMSGVKTIVFGSSGSRRIPEGVSRKEAFNQFVGLCTRMAPVASRYDVVVVLEPLNRSECNFINSVSYGAEIVEAVNHKGFRLLADIYHMKMEDEGAGEIEKYGNLIKHVHIAEKEGRAAPGTHGEDFSTYFSSLKKARYDGSISIESRWEDMELQAPAALSAIREQVRHING